jgi:hypothetical protein
MKRTLARGDVHIDKRQTKDASITAMRNRDLFYFGFNVIGHLATFQFYWWRKSSGARPCFFQARTATWVKSPTYSLLTWKNTKSLSGCEPTALRGKWFEVINLQIFVFLSRNLKRWGNMNKIWISYCFLDSENENVSRDW